MNTKIVSSIAANPAVWQQFNTVPFLFQHSLASNPLFDIKQIRKLAGKLAEIAGPHKLNYYVGDQGANANWSDLSSHNKDVNYCFDHISELGQSFIILKEIQKVPEYGEIIDDVFATLEDVLPRAIYRQFTWPNTHLFIASPGFSTPYHMDHETSLLLQLHGEKSFYVLDANDPFCLSDEEREAYYVGSLDSAVYKDERAEKATVFALKPGLGVQFPVNAPHWVKNGESYSVSLSIGICLQSHNDAAKIYQCNYALRKIGLKPTPPGIHPVKDRAKRLLLDCFSNRTPATMDEMLRSGYRRLCRTLSWTRRRPHEIGTT